MKSDNPFKPNRNRHFETLGDYLYWAYSNLQMLTFGLLKQKDKYDSVCFSVRARAYKNYRDGTWHVHDLMENNVAKMMATPDFCWYCGKDVDSPKELTIDHIIPRSKGGDNYADNIFMVCKECNSSKNDMDLMEWFFCRRNEWPSRFVLEHYLKQIIDYCQKNKLMEVKMEDIKNLGLPFNFRYIPCNFPHPGQFVDIVKEKGLRSL